MAVHFSLDGHEEAAAELGPGQVRIGPVREQLLRSRHAQRRVVPVVEHDLGTRARAKYEEENYEQWGDHSKGVAARGRAKIWWGREGGGGLQSKGG